MHLQQHFTRTLVMGALAAMSLPALAQSHQPVTASAGGFDFLYDFVSDNGTVFSEGPVTRGPDGRWLASVVQTPADKSLPNDVMLVTEDRNVDIMGKKDYHYSVQSMARNGSSLQGNMVSAFDDRMTHAYRLDIISGKFQQLDGGNNVTFANAASPSGQQIVGRVGLGGSQHAFIWSLGGTVKDIGTLGGATSEATAVSSSGDWVAGVSDGYTTTGHAFLYNNAIGMKDLGTLNNHSVRPVAVSTSGSVVAGNTSNHRAFRYVDGRGMQDLGTLGGKEATVVAMSDNGNVIMGYSAPAVGKDHVFVYTQNGMNDLGTLPGAGDFHPAAMSANGGVIVGDFEKDGHRHAFYYVANGQLVDLTDTLNAAYADQGGVRDAYLTQLSSSGDLISGNLVDGQGVQHVFALAR
ncbi:MULTISPECIES: hypothetical protein [unclassified Paludibacterium]|uniref:hypothetical protein n=1 Tax=unclassified Paludibacterium TaxID=2618429 RepID=UPI001C051BA8|nr:hypothetical protein [Paludibacterium sp. B53371]BEV70561.1 hypothetical protein THUN1379_00430 [Paludibacterium sp. THUN1379]